MRGGNDNAGICAYRLGQDDPKTAVACYERALSAFDVAVVPSNGVCGYASSR